MEPEFKSRRPLKKARRMSKTLEEIEDDNLPVEQSSIFF